MAAFLQGFFSEEILFQADETVVIRKATEKAIEIAMMGLANEAREILELVKLSESKETEKSLAHLFSPRLEFLLDQSPLALADSRLISGVNGLDEEKLAELEMVAKDALPHLPEGIKVKDGNEESYRELKEFAKAIEKSGYSHATTGYDSMRLSSALAGLLFMAKDLGREEDIPDLLKRTANRIHANQQSHYFASIRFVWKEYLLPGWLREKLGVSSESMKEYANSILATTKKRLDEGPQNANDLYAEYSIEQLLKELNHNTISSPDFQNGDYAPYPSDEHAKITSILLPPATTPELQETETRIGESLPTGLKEFMKISNGTLRVKTSPLPSFQLRLPSLSAIEWEEEEFMLDYQFILLPNIDLEVEIEWPGIEFGGIAFYENDGQGTEYVWFVTEALVEKAKGVLQAVYDGADEILRGKIDDAIVAVYGSREVYDGMKDCIYLHLWGEPSGQIVWIGFREYLCWVVLESRDMKERSPLKVPEDRL